MHQSTNRAFRLSEVNKLTVKLNPYLSFLPLIFFFFGWGVNWHDERNNKKIPAPLTNELIEQTNLACPRNDVDPCSYSTNEDFALALVAELNSIIMGCPPGEQCGPQCCLSSPVFGLAIPIIINSETINPWGYCYSREDCDSYECGTLGKLCNYADQVVQDSMMARARKKAFDNRPMCGNQLASIKDIVFFLNTITTNCTLGGCYSCEIYIRVYYYSCTCEED